jgi:colanic acid/amylovoran biosynthesis glycosyltransferase
MTDLPDARPLRIAFLLPSFPELTNVFILDQITGLIDRGHHVDLFAVQAKSFEGAHPDVALYRLQERMRHLPVPPDRIARVLAASSLLASRHLGHRAVLDAIDVLRHGRRALSLVGLFTAASFLRSGPYDVLHAQFGTLGPSAERLVRHGAVQAKVVTSFRGADASVHLAAQPRRFAALFRRGDLFLPVSEHLRQVVVAAGAPAERVDVHRSGISLERFAFSERRATGERPRLLFVGRLTEKKGVPYLLEAVAHLRDRGHDVALDLLGDGALRASLEAHAGALGIGDRVRFHGRASHDAVVAAMRDAHVLVTPSVTAADGDQEGIPNVVKEAMASGLPVVATRHGGIPELVEDGVSGVLVPPADAFALADGVATLLDRPERWGPMAAAAREQVAQHYDRERLNDRLVERYRSLLVRPALLREDLAPSMS